MLCKLESQAFNNPDYMWEPKLDGIRIIAVVKDHEVKLFSRSGIEKTALFPDLQIETARDAILDGEVISGKSFTNILRRCRINGITQAAKEYPATYSVFDVLEVSEMSTRILPWADRREMLRIILVPTENVALTPFYQNGIELFDSIKAEGGEGVVGKFKNSPYREGKREWIKVKCWQEDNFIAVGYTAGTGWRSSSFGALVLSDADNNYVGLVGSGFTEQDITNIQKLFSRGNRPWVKEPVPAVWIKPFSVKIKFLEKTNDGLLRFPSFKGVN
jgi:bifunctional non-homologous end joining protein LigD